MLRAVLIQPLAGSRSVHRPVLLGGLLGGLLLALACAGCGNHEPTRAEGAGSTATPGTPTTPGDTGRTSLELEAPRVPQRSQSTSPSAARAARALEFGDLDPAARALGDLPASAEFDRRLLGARLLGLQGDPVGAVREFESLRADFPGQSRVFAAAAELHAAADRLESAEDEIRRGLAQCGTTPELTRARGVLALARQGGAGIGLGHLLRAREQVPELWFCDLALSQAQVLLGNAAMGEQRPLEALGHARAARAAVPDSIDARELEADASAALGDFETALAGYEGLLAEGRDVSATLALLYQRGATAALLVPDRELALEHYLRARALGLPEAELGFGAAVLATEAERLLELGIAHYGSDEFTAARDAFAAALVCAPGSLEIENHLGVSLFRLREFAAAAEHWQRVIDGAREAGVELPEPVHANLARALDAAGDRTRARAVLRAYLDAEPEGEWVQVTTEILAEFDS